MFVCSFVGSLVDSGLGSSESCCGDSEGGAADIVESSLVAEGDGRGVSSDFSANAH